MEIFIPHWPDAVEAGSDSDEFIPQSVKSKFLSQFQELFGSNEVQIDESDIGHGADMPGIIILGVAAWGIFSQGKTFIENLEAWRLIGRKLRNFLKSNNHDHARFDLDAALFLALLELPESFIADSPITVQSCIEVGRQPQLQERYSIEKHPEQIYFFVFRNAGSAVRSVMISSAGSVLSLSGEVRLNNWDFR